jgi:FAD/FMN-containing dehydrogenase
MSETATRNADVLLEVLFLDEETCDPCRTTTATVDRLAAEMAGSLGAVGRTVEVRKIHVTDPEQARELGFVSSPTVRVNGVDIAPDVAEQGCATCGALAGEPVDCRTFTWDGRTYPSPPAKMIIDAVLHGTGAPARSAPDGAATSVDRFLAARIARRAEAAALRDRVRGPVLAAGDGGWDEARATFNTLDDQRPALIVTPADVADVVAVVGFARERGLRVAPQRTGHNATPLGDLSGSVLLRTDALRAVTFDTARRIARVGAGVTWGEVVPALAEFGLAALHGSTPDVSVAGYATGGGVGWYGRAFGLAAHSLTAVDLVTADGRFRRVGARHEPELFWALRGGGGGNFGVITAVEFRVFPVPDLHAGALFFPWERSAEVLHAWRDWTSTVGEETTSVARMMQFPPTPDVPEPLRGRAFAVVEVAHLGTEVDGERLLEPLRGLGPVLDTVAAVGPADLADLHMDPTEPLPYETDHHLLADLTAAAIDDLVDAVGPGSGSGLISVEVRHLGGALARDGGGALARLPGEYLVFGVGAAPDEAAGRAVREWLDAMLAATAPLASGLYLNFTERPVSIDRLFDATTLGRLAAVRAEVDPDGLFRANHPISLPAR